METWINELKKVSFKNPILISGLPGVGYVGKLAVEYLISSLKAEKFAELISYHLPYYVLVDEEGMVHLLKCYFYHAKGGGRDLILLTGDSQAESLEGHYSISEEIIKFAKKLGVSELIVLAGFRAPCREKERRVFAAYIGRRGEEKVKALGITPASATPIVGMAGILVALAQFYGIDGLVLLGETRGYAEDFSAAKAVLKILEKLLGLKIDYSKLDDDIKKAEIARKKFVEDFRERIKEFKERMPSYIS